MTLIGWYERNTEKQSQPEDRLDEKRERMAFFWEQEWGIEGRRKNKECRMFESFTQKKLDWLRTCLYGCIHICCKYSFSLSIPFSPSHQIFKAMINTLARSLPLAVHKAKNSPSLSLGLVYISGKWRGCEKDKLMTCKSIIVRDITEIHL